MPQPAISNRQATGQAQVGTASTPIRPVGGGFRFSSLSTQPQPPLGPPTRRRPTIVASSDSSSRVKSDADFISIGKLDESMQRMQRSVFDQLKPLESGAGRSAPSPGLVENMNVLSMKDKAESISALSKPQLSFACLIGTAILASDDKRLTVSEVYEWMKRMYPYFASPAAGTGWKNSVRHNLSLNKHFVKQNRDISDAVGKGSYWTIRPESIPVIEAAIRKQEESSCVTSPSPVDVAGRPVQLQTRVPKTGSRWSVQRPKPQAFQRRQSLEIDDQMAASLLCGLVDDKSHQDPQEESKDTMSELNTDERFATALPNLQQSRRRSGSGSSTTLFATPVSPRRSQHSAPPKFHASYSPTANIPSRAGPRSGIDGASAGIKHFTYIPSSGNGWKHDVSSPSTSFAAVTPQAERLFSQKAPPTPEEAQMKTDVADDVRLEDVPKVGRTQAAVAAERPREGVAFFKFSAPMSFSNSRDPRRFTPEMDSSRRRLMSNESYDATGMTPPKMRRKLAIPTDDTTSAAAALLELSCM